MTIDRPRATRLRRVAEELGIALEEAQLGEILELTDAMLEDYRVLDAEIDDPPPIRYPRTPGQRPRAEDDPLNAWFIRTTIPGAAEGKLAGRTVAVKDTVCLAGVPMMAGASILDGYVPDEDATIVTRLLDAGGTITGKAQCEYLCISGSSVTNSAGPTHNPWRRGHSCGGSSSGSAALVATGEVDMAIGGDQGGSVRIPAALCGVVGMKPTFGLVPCTGVLPIEVTLDHVGPMTATVTDNALMLEVIAGPDGLDPRQGAARVEEYTRDLRAGAEGLRIGLVREGFGQPGSDPEVEAKVRAAAERMRALGAVVEEVSLPEHRLAKALWTSIGAEGLTRTLMLGNGHVAGYGGRSVTSLMGALAGWRTRVDDLDFSVKLMMLVGHDMDQRYGGRCYAKAQNLVPRIRAAHDALLRDHDLLLMPTVPIKAPPFPPPEVTPREYIAHVWQFHRNCCATNLTGHPALSVPCGLADGLPVGMMLIGRPYAETTLYRAGAAFEADLDWRTL
jgi:amidase